MVMNFNARIRLTWQQCSVLLSNLFSLIEFTVKYLLILIFLYTEPD